MRDAPPGLERPAGRGRNAASAPQTALPTLAGPRAAPARSGPPGALLNVHSYYSFGAGTASPRSLAARAAELGYRYLALTDHLNVTGGVELFQAAREHGLRALLGATVPVRVGERAYPFVLLAMSRAGYGVLNELLTLAHESEEKEVPLPALLAHTTDLALLTGGREGLPSALLARRRLRELEGHLRELAGAFPGRLYVQLYHDRYRWDHRRARVLRRLASELALPVVAAPQVRYLRPADYRLYDALLCARLGITVLDPHPKRPQNAEQYLLDPAEVRARLPFPEALANAERLAEECAFDLLPERLSPPPARVPPGVTPQQHLEERCYAALLERYAEPGPRGDRAGAWPGAAPAGGGGPGGEGTPSPGGPRSRLARARAKLEEELVTIRALGLAEFFLTAAEVTDFCRSRGILAAGRGSAAASICCYLLGITQADPLEHDLLFERFLHTGKTSMPDVDIDVSSARRDEVLDWVEERFGPAEAMVCNKITYRLPLALQDLGRALGLPAELRNRLTAALGRDYRGLRPPRADLAAPALREVLGDSPALGALLSLLRGMEGKHARHLAPHAGGVVLSRERLEHYSPLERSTGGIRLLQLDKDDAEALGLIKLDLLGLRMLSALERAREEVFRLEGVWLDLTALPDDEGVWDLISGGHTLGLFQVESPSQTHVSTVMRARNLRDLAHQIALIRPGPIQSGTVHPYLRRRRGLEEVSYPHPSLEPILEKTLGVLLFQEDVLRIAVHFAGMSWTEADRFRKKVSSWDEPQEIESDREGFIAGAARTVGAAREQAEAVFEMIAGFQGYGFAESHAWAFALHAYASGWLRLHYPAEYMAAILTEEPGMWSPATKRQEARAWGVGFLPFDVNASGAHYRCERVRGAAGKAVRPPLSALKGVSADAAREVLLARLEGGPFSSVDDLYARAPLPLEVFEALARGGALDSLAPRREALYRLGVLAGAQRSGERPLFTPTVPAPALAPLAESERFVWDHEVARFSTLELHVLDLLRDRLRELGAVPLARLARLAPGAEVRSAGLVVSRQRPPTAKGYAFYVVEDGPVRAQLIIPPELWEARRVVLRDAVALVFDARLAEGGGQPALRVEALYPLAAPLAGRGYHFG